jgi:hypothetical protein
MKRFALLCLVLLGLLFKSAAAQDDETALYSANGTPVAYISFERGDDEPVIYMWSGKPVAYLASTSSEGFNVYGFNGKHLGWFVKGIVRDHDGNAACGVKNVVRSPKLEPLKSLKQLVPLKALTVLEPLTPLFSSQWSIESCSVFLFEGAK